MLRLKKHEDKRLRRGHPWIYSNEIDNKATPLKTFKPGAVVKVAAQDGSLLGAAYVNPHSLIAARLFSSNPDQLLDREFFAEKFRAALASREQYYANPYYRLIFSEADGIPGLIVDRFNHDCVVQINTAGMEEHKQTIADALCEVLPQTRSILLRNDSPIRVQEGLTTYVEPIYGEPPDTVMVEENDVRFNAPLVAGQKTGWFYDHRDNRARLRRYVQDRQVLDVFSYLGGFGIQAACFGAKQVDCVDVSNAACEFIKQNAAANKVEDKVNVIPGDAFDVMKSLIQSGKRYDVVILDPPAFVKKSKDRKEGLIAYQRINELAIKLLTPNGILVSCSCSMHVSMEDLTMLIQHAAARTGQTLQIIERGHQGLDHPVHPAIPEMDYLKAIFARKMG